MTQNIFPIKINLRTPTHITKGMKKKIQLKKVDILFSYLSLFTK